VELDMRYFCYNEKTKDEYCRIVDSNKVYREVELSATENRKRMEECIAKINKEKFISELRYLGINFETINFDTMRYTVKGSKEELYFDNFSRGERITFFLCMAKITNLKFVAKGFMDSLSTDNKVRMFEYLKGYCNDSIIILLSMSNMPVNRNKIGGGYYVY
jgi:hypothetical protein